MSIHRIGRSRKVKFEKSHEREADLASYPSILVNSGKLAKYYELMTEFEFLADKLDLLGVQTLINDYDLLDDREILDNPEYNPEKVKALKLIQGALRLSLHILANDNTQLAEQLLGRMQCFEVPEIQAMLSQAKQWKAKPWLRPLTPSLTPPGGAFTTYSYWS